MSQTEKTFFTWDQKYLLKVDEMDNEHKVLIKLMNELFTFNEKNAAFKEIDKKITELADFTVKHFQHEETYFSSLPYEKAAVHKKIHADLLEKLGAHAGKIRAEQKVNDEFFSFLKVWLSAHIVGIDQGYAAVSVQKNGARAG